MRLSKNEVRRAKRDRNEAAVFRPAEPSETKCDSGDLLRIVGRAFERLLKHDHDEHPDRLLKAMRSAGWLSYRADPARKMLVRCDQEDWMRGREDELPEQSHRHPKAWWEERYKWLGENGEPRKPDFKSCGRNVRGLQYMRDEFPEQEPDETTKLHCLTGKKLITLPCINLTEDDDELTFPEVAANLRPAEFLKTQREKFEAARLRALTSSQGRDGKQALKRGVVRLDRRGVVRLDRKTLRAKMRRKLSRRNTKQSMRAFLSELRARAGQGYSLRQLIKSHIPAIGAEDKVADTEVTAALAKREAADAGDWSGVIL